MDKRCSGEEVSWWLRLHVPEEGDFSDMENSYFRGGFSLIASFPALNRSNRTGWAIKYLKEEKQNLLEVPVTGLHKRRQLNQPQTSVELIVRRNKQAIKNTWVSHCYDYAVMTVRSIINAYWVKWPVNNWWSDEELDFKHHLFPLNVAITKWGWDPCGEEAVSTFPFHFP